MDKPDLTQLFTWFNAWELSQWLGVSVETAMELAWFGQIPRPRCSDPLLWHADDLHEWQSAGCPVREVEHAGRAFKPKIYLKAK